MAVMLSKRIVKHSTLVTSQFWQGLLCASPLLMLRV